MSVELDAEQFWARVTRLYSKWNKNREKEANGWNGVDSWSFVVGKTSGDSGDNLGEVLILYLLGFTFTDTLLVFTKDTLYITASKKKLKILEQLKTDPRGAIKLSFVEKKKGETTECFASSLEAIKTSFDGKKFGFPKGDKFEGSFAPVWKSELEKAAGDGLVDINSAIQMVIARKDESELDTMKKVGNLASRVMKYACVKRMEDIIDEDQSISHAAFSAEIEEKIRKPSDVKSKLPAELCDTIFTPGVQSGGKYSFKLGIEPTKDKLSFDSIIFSVGTRYKDYNSCIARTFLVDPTDEQERIYTLLAKVHQLIIAKLRPGAILGDIYNAAVAKIQSADSKLVSKFTSNAGWAVGLLFLNKSYVIKASNKQKVESGMTFCVRTGFDNVALTSKQGPKKISQCSFLLTDTVAVTKESTDPFTKYNIDFPDIIYQIAESSDEDDKSESGKEDSKVKKEKVGDNDVFVVGENKIKRSLRSSHKTAAQIEQEQTNASLEKEIETHQKKLMKKKAKEAAKTKLEDRDSDNDEKKVEIVKKYQSTSKYPHGLKRNQVFCDPDRECVFLPIFGYHVPFHISVIKNVSKMDEEHATLLRINFYYPTGNVGYARDTPVEARAVLEKYKDFNYVKEMSFRSRDSHNLNHQMRLIKELQKRVKQRLKKKEMEVGLVEQADLIVSREGRKPTLLDISMKPSIRKGKCVGRLAAHVNGFRFRTNRGEMFDLIYSNIKHFFYQPCEKELVVLIHFHLYHPMLVGRVKTKDIQFYAEVVEGSTALDSSSHRRGMYDPDEIDEENRERQLRKRLNQAFKSFCNQVLQTVEANNLTIGQGNEYDIPYRALGFNGVPNKEMVLLQPTVYCLVNLTETPFFVMSMDEVEHIHFERTDFRVSKTFDIVFILKRQMKLDSQEVPQRVQSIPVDKFDTIKQWIHEKGDITFTNGATPLNWKMVMMGVRQELEAGVFWSDVSEDGENKSVGWNFLLAQDEDDEEEGGDAESDGSKYSESSAAEEEESSDDWSMDEEEESSGFEEDSEDDAPDWDELHREAAKSDKVRARKEVDTMERESRKKPAKKKRRRR